MRGRVGAFESARLVSAKLVTFAVGNVGGGEKLSSSVVKLVQVTHSSRLTVLIAARVVEDFRNSLADGFAQSTFFGEVVECNQTLVLADLNARDSRVNI